MTAVVVMVLVAQIALGAEAPGAEARRVEGRRPEVRSAIPSNIQAGLLGEDIETLIQASPTFRAQCERIGTARYLRVVVELVQIAGGPRAETTITRYQAGAVRAEVRISFGQDYRELVAHEFEHVIEQLDGVDLRSEADHGRAWLVDAHVFETRRASEVGRRVRRESEILESRPGVSAHALR